eukprot:gene7403-13157_t
MIKFTWAGAFITNTHSWINWNEARAIAIDVSKSPEAGNGGGDSGALQEGLLDDEGIWDLKEVLDLFEKEVQLSEKCIVSNESSGSSTRGSWRKPIVKEYSGCRHNQPSTTILPESRRFEVFLLQWIAYGFYLKLQIIGKEKQLIKVFGDSEPKFHECDIVQLTVVCSDGLRIYMKAYSIPLICSLLINQCIDVAIKQYPYLQGLPLADYITSKEQVDIDLLIGSDYYWSFVGGPPVRGEGATAVPTGLGFILNGLVKEIYNVCSSTHVQTIHVTKAEMHSFKAEKQMTLLMLISFGTLNQWV